MAQAALTSAPSLPPILAAKLHRLRRRLTLWLVVDGLSRLAATLALLLAVDLAIDWLFGLDREQRIVMLVLAAALAGYVAYRWLIRPLAARTSDDALCLEIERRHPELGQSLISAVQLARLPDAVERGVSPQLVDAAIRQGTERAGPVAFESVLDRRRFRASLALLLVAGLLLGSAATSVAWSQALAIWFERNLLLGERAWPQDTILTIAEAVDGRLRIPRGDDWLLVVHVQKDTPPLPEEVYVDFRHAGGRRSELLQRHDEGRRFEVLLPAVIEQYQLRVRSGRARTAWVSVELVDRPEVKDLALRVTAPAYAQLPPEELPAGKGPYYVLPGSRLEIRGTASKTLSSATLRIDEAARPLEILDGTRFQADLAPVDVLAATYGIELIDTERLKLPGRSEPGPLSSQRPARFALRFRTDHEPQFQRFSQPGISSMVVPGARIPLAALVEDDFAVSDLRLEYQWRADASDAPPTVGQARFDLVRGQLGKPRVTIEDAWELGPLAIPAGSGLSFHLAADDNDDVSGPKTGLSVSVLLRVVNEDELRADLLRREKEQRQEFERHVKTQEDLLTEVQALAADTRQAAELQDVDRQQLMELQKNQKLLGTNLTGMAERLAAIVAEVRNNRLEDESGPLGRRLSEEIIAPLVKLADEEIPAAAGQLEEARRLAADAAMRDQTLAAVAAHQEQIAAAMRDVLRHMVKTEGYQEAINLLYEIQRSQREVYQLTDKEKLRLVLPPGGSTPGTAPPSGSSNPPPDAGEKKPAPKATEPTPPEPSTVPTADPPP